MTGVTSVLTNTYLCAGALQYEPVKEMWTGVSTAQADEFWITVHLAALSSGGLLEAPGVPSWFEQSPALDEFIGNLDQVSQLPNVLSICVEVASVCIESPPLRPSTSHELLRWMAYEGTLWRAFDGFQASKLLSTAGLGAGTLLELRAAQEALLLHHWFRAKPSRVKRYCLAKDVEELDTLSSEVQFARDTFGTLDSGMMARMHLLSQRLRELGLTTSVSDHGEVTYAGTKPNCRPEWRSLAQDRFKHDHPHNGSFWRMYSSIFERGNSSAHTTRAFWANYVSDSELAETVGGRIKRECVTIPSSYYVTAVDFMDALVASRPQLKSHLVDWVHVCHSQSLRKERIDRESEGR